MTEISNKKRKFIKRNFKHLSIEELSRKTGLKSNVIKSIIAPYRAEIKKEDQKWKSREICASECYRTG